MRVARSQISILLEATRTYRFSYGLWTIIASSDSMQCLQWWQWMVMSIRTSYMAGSSDGNDDSVTVFPVTVVRVLSSASRWNSIVTTSFSIKVKGLKVCNRVGSMKMFRTRTKRADTLAALIVAVVLAHGSSVPFRSSTVHECCNRSRLWPGHAQLSSALIVTFIDSTECKKLGMTGRDEVQSSNSFYCSRNERLVKPQVTTWTVLCTCNQ